MKTRFAVVRCFTFNDGRILSFVLGKNWCNIKTIEKVVCPDDLKGIRQDHFYSSKAGAMKLFNAQSELCNDGIVREYTSHCELIAVNF